MPAEFVAYALTKYKVLGFKPVILLVKVPLPVPSEVCDPVTTGPDAVLQQTPRAVTAAPPFEVIFPPETAVVRVGDVTVAVVNAGVVGDVVNDMSFP